MALTATYSPAGLWTNPNPHSEVPPGGLSKALNVVHRRPGMLEPRPGFEPYRLQEATAVNKDVFEFDGDLLMIAEDIPIGNDWILEWRSNATVVVSPPLFNTGEIFAAEARNNLYLNARDDVYKLEASQDTTIVRAGIDQPTQLQFQSSAVGTAITTLMDVRYASTITRTDSNDVIVESSPSQSLVVQNTTGGTIDVTIRVQLPPTAIATDIVRLFRSEEVPNDATPSENMQLVEERELTSSEITAGFIDIVDDTPIADRGANIYTAPNEGGIGQANERPPACKDIALFKRSLWFANTRLPHQLGLNTTVTSDDLTGLADGVGSRFVDGVSTLGSPTITGVTTTVGIQEGMFSGDLASIFPAGTLVVSTTATTVTYNKNATVSNPAVGITVHDSVSIDGITYQQGIDGILVTAVNVGVAPVLGDINDNGGVPDPIVFATSLVTLVNGTAGAPGGTQNSRIVLQRRDGSDTAFVVQATHGDEYTPVIPLPPAAGLSSTAVTRENGLYWSKDSQPEHVPVLNFIIVGSGERIDRIVPTRDSMWIFKRDGIFRLTGNGAGPKATWRVDEWDLSSFLAITRSPAVLHDSVYCATNQGIVVVNDAGVENISRGPIQDLVQGSLNTASTRTPEANEELWGFSAPLTNEYWVQTNTGITSKLVFVWNAYTKSWTELELPAGPTAGLYRIATNQFVFLDGNDEVLWESDGLVSKSFDMADQEFNFVGTINANLIDVEITSTDPVPDNYIPQVGDCVKVAFGETGSNETYIVAVADSTNFTVANALLQSGAGNDFTGAPGFDIELEYQYRAPGAGTGPAGAGHSPALAKNFYIVTWTFDSWGSFPNADYEFTTPLVPTPVIQTRAFALTGQPNQTDEPLQLRGYVDKNHARTTQIKPALKFQGACGIFRHTGIQMVYNPVGEKVAER